MQEYIEQIKNNGYCKIPGMYRQNEVDHALRLAKRWYERTKDSLTDKLPYLAKNDFFVWNLQNKDYYFLKLLFASNQLHYILKYFLNDRWFKQIPADKPNYILRSFMARSSNKRLPLHIDSLVPYLGPEVFVVQVAIVLEDEDKNNGCTMVIPGSHLSGQYVDQNAFRDAIPIEAKAGDLILWDSRVWHGAEENNTDGSRWVIIATFTRWWIKQMFNLTQTLPQKIYEKLTPNEKAILGFCSIPYDDESKGVDMKRGYESLLDDVSGYRRELFSHRQ